MSKTLYQLGFFAVVITGVFYVFTSSMLAAWLFAALGVLELLLGLSGWLRQRGED